MNLDASGGHCAARQRRSWEVFVNPLMAWRQLCDHVRAKGLQARMLYNGSGRATVAELLPGFSHLRSISSPARPG